MLCTNLFRYVQNVFRYTQNTFRYVHDVTWPCSEKVEFAQARGGRGWGGGGGWSAGKIFATILV